MDERCKEAIEHLINGEAGQFKTIVDAVLMDKAEEMIQVERVRIGAEFFANASK